MKGSKEGTKRGREEGRTGGREEGRGTSNARPKAGGKEQFYEIPRQSCLRKHAQAHGQQWFQPEELAFRLEDLALERDTGGSPVSAGPHGLQVSIE